MGKDIARSYAMSQRELENRLGSLSKDQMLCYLKLLSEDYEVVNSFFQLEFAPVQNIFSLSCDHMNYYINAGKIDGRIPFQNVAQVIQGGEQVLEKANKCMENMNTEQAALLCVAVLCCYIPILNYSDDSIDAISFLIDRCISCINNITLFAVKNSKNSDEKNVIYKIIRDHACEQIYDNWIDWRADILSACVCLAEDESIKKSLYDTVDEIIAKLPDNKWYKKYVTKRLKEIIYSIIKTFDGDDSAHHFVWENLDYDNFRDIAINLSLSKKDYRTVVKLCKDISDINGVDGNRIFKWKNDILEAYRSLGDIENQKRILEDFILQGRLEYYNELKFLYSTDEWTDQVVLILELLKDEKDLIRKYLDILVIENKQELMLEYCLDNPQYMIYVYNDLCLDNQNKLHESFEKYILEIAQKSTARNEYKFICTLLAELEKKCNKPFADKIIIKLQQEYSRKSAFVEELNNILNSDLS